MPENLESNIWIWKEPDRRWKKEVINHIKDNGTLEKDLIILHCMEVEGFDESIPLANYMLDLCQMFKVFEMERMMFLNPKDLFLAIELCLVRQAGKDTSEAEISDEDIIQCHQTYIKQFKNEEGKEVDQAVVHLKKFMKENNCADLWLMNDQLLKQRTEDNGVVEHLSNLKFLILGSLPMDILKSVICMMFTSDVIMNVTVETPLNISLQSSPSPNSSQQEIQVSSEPLQIQEIVLDSPRVLKLPSATEEYVEDMIVAFLSLLVNSRNEISLSKAMISPIIDLSHEAFTKLKHLAQEKEMPMCQTAISYVTRMRLGGKGYAPPSDCPMLPHIKSLELFVDILNQMQTLVEEDLKPISAIKRLLNILKKKLLKCGSDKLKPTAIETASENLKLVAEKVVNIMKSKECSNATPQICQESLDALHCFVNYINCSCSTFDPKRILLEKNAKRTPINLPPLLGYFRSPDDESSCEASEVNEDSIVSVDTSLLNAPQPLSYFHHSDNSSVSVTCVDSCTPTKTSFNGCLGEREDKVEDIFTKPKNKVMAKKGRKRSILGELTNEISSENERTTESRPKKQADKEKEIVETKDATKKETKSKQTEKRTKKQTNKEKEIVKTKDTTKKETKSNKKGAKKFKLIEGQGKITSFFTMK